ncbi:unnamed protein product [Coffea canephora]|uniref:Magnesium transporter n=1 Tax=Coffea canephora TaxID=49390 RepID=A0A068TS88_COFCA|nr:unnamed protein product [Coffea canephora]
MGIITFQFGTLRMFRADEGPSRPLLFSTGGGGTGDLLKKAAGSRSWMLMNSSGQEMILDVDKYEILDRLQIHPRDLRMLDPLLSYPSTILSRERAIILNLEHIKAIITAEEVLIQDPLDDNVLPVVEKLRRRLNPVDANHRHQGDDQCSAAQHDVEVDGEDSNCPFEFKALEVALEAICSYLAASATEFEAALYPSLDLVTSKINSRHLDHIRKLKSQITRLAARSQKVRDGLQQLLDDGDSMADLYLSRKVASSPLPTSRSIPNIAKLFLAAPSVSSRQSEASRESIVIVHGDENDVAALEMLLEDNFKQIDGTLNRLTTLREYISNTEDCLNIQLDNLRNQFIQIELVLSAAAASIAIHSLVAGIFSVSVPYTWNNGYAYTFKWVAGVPGVFSAVLFVVILFYARKKGLLGS